MKTDDLIQMMARDDTAPRALVPDLTRVLTAALICGVLVTALVLGFRANMAEAMTTPVTSMKWLLPLLAGAVGLAAAVRLARPVTQTTPSLWLGAGLGFAVAIWWGFAALNATPELLWPLIRGRSALICLSSVVAISVVPMALGLRCLSRGASLHPTRSGAALGLGVGGLAAAIYALHCDEDAPLFFLTWYTLGILIVTSAGALAGRRMLRW